MVDSSRVLWYIPRGRTFSLFTDWISRVDFIDKLIVWNHLTHEAHKIAVKYFLEHDYEYLIMGHDDYLGSPDHVRLLLEDEEEHHFPIISGWSNIWLPPNAQQKPYTASISLSAKNLRIHRNVTMDSYGFIPMRDIVMAKHGYPFFKAWFVGFPLTLLRREVVEKIPFRPFKQIKDDFCPAGKTRGIIFDLYFAMGCKRAKIPITIDARVFLLHFGKIDMYKYLRMGKDKPKVQFIKRRP